MRNGRTLGVLAATVLVVVLAIAGFLTSRGGDAPPAAGLSTTASDAAVPERAWRTLAYIDDGDWPEAADAPGTKGGQTWQNRDGDLPRTDPSGQRIRYQEWDVNPKQQGRSRDAERIVTGSDGSAWYTADHYETFARMR